MGTIKRNDSRTSLRVKELISSARSNEDLGAKIKEQEEREGEREMGGQNTTHKQEQKLIHLMNVLGYL